jgi:hypothetical protein
MKKIYIGGLVVSGKGLMKQLLDGHPRLCIMPFQGFILKWLAGYDFSKLEKNSKFSNPYRGSYYKNLPFFTFRDKNRAYRISFDEFIRNIHYCYDLYSAYRSKQLWGVAAAGVDVSVDFIFDFFAYEEEWFERLFVKRAEVSIEEFLNIMYSCFVNNWKNSHVKKGSEYSIVTPLQNGINPIRWLLDNTKDAKILLMDRDCVGFSFALAKKKSLHLNKPLDSQLYNLSFVNVLKEYRDFIHSPDVKNDRRVLIVGFEKLVLDTYNTMCGIADFLGLGFEEILTKATLNGVLLESADKMFTGVIQEDPVNVLSSDTIDFLRYIYGVPASGRTKMKIFFYWIKVFSLKVVYNAGRLWQRCVKLMEIIMKGLIK